MRSKSKSLGESLFRTTNTTLRSVLNSTYHFLGLFILLVAIKVIFKDDVGDYILYMYLTFLLLLSMFQIMNSSSYFEKPSSFLEFPSLKYQKSSLTDETKKDILKRIEVQMNEYKYFKSKHIKLQ